MRLVTSNSPVRNKGEISDKFSTANRETETILRACSDIKHFLELSMTSEKYNFIDKNLEIWESTITVQQLLT